jgi:hypothetical protein
MQSQCTCTSVLLLLTVVNAMVFNNLMAHLQLSRVPNFLHLHKCSPRDVCTIIEHIIDDVKSAKEANILKDRKITGQWEEYDEELQNNESEDIEREQYMTSVTAVELPPLRSQAEQANMQASSRKATRVR